MPETLPEQLVHTLPEDSGLGACNGEELLNLYREMLLIRRVEELAAKAYTSEKFWASAISISARSRSL